MFRPVHVTKETQREQLGVLARYSNKQLAHTKYIC